MMTGKEYIESIRKMRPNIYKFGKLIEDLTTDPATAQQIISVARSYDYCTGPDEKLKEIYTYKSSVTGKVTHRWNTLMDSLQAVIENARMKRHQYRQSGTTQGSTCTGWTGLNALWAATYDMDNALGTDYHQRLKKYWVEQVEARCLAMAGAITDAKGDRGKTPSQQVDDNYNLHMVEKHDDGIVVSGYKIQICGVVGAHEIICVPGSGYGEADKKFCVAFAVPRDAEGLTIVECRMPSDTRYAEPGGWDVPTIEGNCGQAYLLFDKVFIPNDRVFMAGEYKFSGNIIGNFASIYRAAIGSCVAGQGDVMIGAAINMARANGLSMKVFQNVLNEMAINNETTYSTGIGAMALGQKHPAGIWLPAALQAHLTKVLVSRIPTDTKYRCVEIGGGITETGCMPSYRDIEDPKYGKQLQAALAGGGGDGVSRAKMARLVEWLVAGSGLSGCQHGGGSADGGKLAIRAMTKWEDFAADARRIVGVSADAFQEPGKK